MKAIRIHEPGDLSQLHWEDVDLPTPGPGEVRLRHTAIGVNFLDTYYRSGLYKAPELPLILGSEGAGVVTAVGEGVSRFRTGDRVAYVSQVGAYAEERLMPADRLVSIPDGVSDETAAASMIKGMTAYYLLHQTFPVQAGQTVLFHAAAGGVGLLAGQWGARIGATMIGTAGSAEKVALAKEHGYAHVINYREEDFVPLVKELTNGKGVDVVYDSVGQAIYPKSLDCLRPRGMWVCFGQSSGPIKNFELTHLVQRGSLYATRPTLFTYISTRRELETAATALFAVLADGSVHVPIHQRYPLQDVAEAHRALENRETTGSTILYL